MGERWTFTLTGSIPVWSGTEDADRTDAWFLDTFYKKGAFLLVDPIMGDEGKIFSIFTPELLVGMKELAGEADLITPNLTELCLLTGTDYRMLEQMTDEKHLVTIAEQMGQNFLRKGSNSHVKKAVVVTGIRFKDETTGAMKIGNLVVTKRQTKLLAFPYIGGSFSGTGDLFASILAGGMARGEDLFETVELAGTLIGAAMADAAEEKVPRNEGANYEKYLGMLIPGADWKKFREARRIKNGRDIVYLSRSVYVNLTNKCDCNCKFCIRTHHDTVGDAQTLWHKADPTT